MSDVKHTPYSKEAMDKARKLSEAMGHSEIPCGAIDAFATYIQQVSDAVYIQQVSDAVSANVASGMVNSILTTFIPSDPVDPLLLEAREIVAKVNEDVVPGWSERVRKGRRDDHIEIRIALAALKSREAK